MDRKQIEREKIHTQRRNGEIEKTYRSREKKAETKTQKVDILRKRRKQEKRKIMMEEILRDSRGDKEGKKKSRHRGENWL